MILTQRALAAPQKYLARQLGSFSNKVEVLGSIGAIPGGPEGRYAESGIELEACLKKDKQP